MRSLLLFLALAAGPAWAEAPSDQLAQILADPAAAPAHAVTWAQLAQGLGEAGYPEAALLAAAKAVALDPTTAAVAVPVAFQALEKVPDDAAIASIFAQNVGLPVSEADRPRVALLAARDHLSAGNVPAATALVAMIPGDGPLAADAAMLKGVALAQDGKFEESAQTLQLALDIGKRTNKDVAFQDMAALNLARAWFGAKNWGQAMYAYAQVGRGHPAWVNAQTERAWAHFRANDVNGTLSLLTSFESPSFDEYNLGEADLLRAYALFVACKFTEATKRIDTFGAHYFPMRNQIAKALGREHKKPLSSQVDVDTSAIPVLDANSAFEAARALATGGETAVPKAGLRSFVLEDRFNEAVATVTEIDREIPKLDKAGTAWSALAKGLLVERRAALVQGEGARILARMTEDLAFLDERLDGMEITRIDLLQMEEQMYQRAAATGKIERERSIVKLRRLSKQKGVHVWPFEGEYWEDELGWFRVETPAECPLEGS